MVKINVLNNYHTKFLDKKTITNISKIVLEEMDKDNVEMTIVLCGNDEIRNYNRDFRGKDYPTDVLSFPDGDRVGRYVYLGDIIISIDKVYEQSSEFGVKPYEEFVRLLVHGILHLLGYDHETSEEDEKVMMEIQDRIIDKILSSFT